MPTTVDQLVSEIRTATDEINTEYESDTEILQTLNRAQRNATNIISRKYPDLFTDWVDITTDGEYNYDLPTEAAGRRVVHVESYYNEIAYPMARITEVQASNYRTNAQSARPIYYLNYKNHIQFLPRPTSGIRVRVYYIKRSQPLVLSQGRINLVDSGDNLVRVDAIGPDLATTTSGFASYVNFIDYNTGAVKGSCQIAAIDTDTNEITFKTSGLTRTSVLGLTISTTLPTDLAEDDYICLVTGTCVPELDDVYCDFLLQYSVVDIRRRFGEPLGEELEALERISKELEEMWAGRKPPGRIRKANGNYRNTNGSLIRYFQ
jgi:hypothetical protein